MQHSKRLERLGQQGFFIVHEIQHRKKTLVMNGVGRYMDDGRYLYAYIYFTDRAESLTASGAIEGITTPTEALKTLRGFESPSPALFGME